MERTLTFDNQFFRNIGHTRSLTKIFHVLRSDGGEWLVIGCSSLRHTFNQVFHIIYAWKIDLNQFSKVSLLRRKWTAGHQLQQVSKVVCRMEGDPPHIFVKY